MKYLAQVSNRMQIGIYFDKELQSVNIQDAYQEALNKFGKKRLGGIKVSQDGEKSIAISRADAENHLYEMDAHGIDTITITEGFGIKTTYTRKDIENMLFSDDKYSALKLKKAFPEIFANA